jgi:alkylhydroperoxidase family enzyme
MTFLPPITDEEATEPIQEPFQTLRQRVGLVPNMYRTLAHAPKVLQTVLSMGQAIRTGLDPKLRELAYLKIAQIHDCHY